MSKENLEYSAQIVWRILMDLGIQDGCCKSYDPLTIEGNTAHSYVFDFEDGGRHHQFKDFEHLKKMLIDEAVKEISQEIHRREVEAFNQGIEEIAKLYDAEASDLDELIQNSDTSTAISILSNQRDHWVRMAKFIRNKLRKD